MARQVTANRCWYMASVSTYGTIETTGPEWVNADG
jgi:hypothetical protein